jgi:DNA-binding PucR family transcriptional regulator
VTVVERDASETIREVVALVGDRFGALMSDSLESFAEILPALAHDGRERRVLARATTDQLESARRLLAGDHDVHEIEIAPITSALAREAVHWRLPLEKLMEAYHKAHQVVWSWWLAQLDDAVEDPVERLNAVRLSADLFFAAMSASLHVTVDAYAAEREVWLQGQTFRVRQTVESILASGTEIDAAHLSRVLGYDLSLWHVAAIVWLDESKLVEPRQALLNEAAAALATALGAFRPLRVRVDELTSWLWLPFLQEPAFPPSPLPRFDAATQVVIGQPAKGAAGFGVSHHQARAAYALALRADLRGQVVMFSQAEIASLIDADLARRTNFVERHLGGLAHGDGAAENMREALRAYARTGSIQSAAGQLHMHRNTFARLLKSAERERGRPIGDERLPIALALELLELYGDSMLT